MIPTPPPVPFVGPGRFVISPYKLVRQNKQHTPQLEKQSTKKTIVCKSSPKSNRKQVAKRIFDNMREKMQKEKDKKIVLREKLCQLLPSKKLQKLCKDKASLYQAVLDGSGFSRMRGKRGLNEVSNTGKKVCHWSPEKNFLLENCFG